MACTPLPPLRPQVQEAALYAPWCDCALRHPAWPPAKAPGGALLARGPRLKMGVCEGAPRAVIPDHAGRADYHGASVNQAARYMDAAAQGGMVRPPRVTPACAAAPPRVCDLPVCM